MGGTKNIVLYVQVYASSVTKCCVINDSSKNFRTGKRFDSVKFQLTTILVRRGVYCTKLDGALVRLNLNDCVGSCEKIIIFIAFRVSPARRVKCTRLIVV